MSEQNQQSGVRKIAIVTGGSRGIGRNTVVSLAKREVDSIFTFHTRGEDAKAVITEAKAAGAQAIALQLDAGDIASFDGFVANVENALAQLGQSRFDFLVNNAGNSHHNMPFEKATEEELDSIYNVHFKGVFFLTQKLLPLIRDGGRILNVSTARTRIASPGGAVYGSMKGAVEVLSRYMALELGPRRIGVNVVAPARLLRISAAASFATIMWSIKGSPRIRALGRAGLPDDLGPVIASLLSEENRWINAQRIEVAGGVAI